MTGRARARRLAVTAGVVLALLPGGRLVAQDLACDPGDQEVRALEFEGNRHFSDGQLAFAVVTTPSSKWGGFIRRFGERRCLDRAELPRDSLRLFVLHRRSGYPDAQVAYEVRPTGRADEVVVRFRITEGEPTILDSLSIVGLDSVPRELGITRGLPIRTGVPFDRFALDATIDTLERRLRNAGYPEAQVLQSWQADAETRRAEARLQVSTGQRARIGEIHVHVTPFRGREQQIPDDVVRRLLGLEEGRYYSERERLEAQRNLYLTDAYDAIDVRLAADTVPDGDDSLLVLDVALRERKMQRMRAGIGWATLDCLRGQAQYTNNNFLHGAQRLELGARISKVGIGEPLDVAEGLCTPDAKEDPFSDTLNYALSATLRWPVLLGLRNPPTLTLYSQRQSEYKVYLRSVPIGGVASLTRQATRSTPVTYGYQLELGRTTAEPALFCAVFNICTGEDREEIQKLRRLAIFSVAVEHDRTDNRIDPSRGWLARLEGRHASRFVWSDRQLEFNRAIGELSWYRRLGRAGDVLALRVRGGAVFGNRLSLDADAVLSSTAEFVPPQERLYAGGASSVRGFRQNELGPLAYLFTAGSVTGNLPDDSVSAGDTLTLELAPGAEPERRVPIGGSRLLVANAEYRFPSPFLPGLLQWTAFVDAGDVWERGVGSGLSLRVTPGLGLRIATPVGAARVDVAYNGYARPAGPAYLNLGRQPDGTAPLLCMSGPVRVAISEVEDPATPGRMLKVRTPVQDGAAGGCAAAYEPEPERGFFRRLNLNFSIGQAF